MNRYRYIEPEFIPSLDEKVLPRVHFERLLRDEDTDGVVRMLAFTVGGTDVTFIGKPEELSTFFLDIALTLHTLRNGVDGVPWELRRHQLETDDWEPDDSQV